MNRRKETLLHLFFLSFGVCLFFGRVAEPAKSKSSSQQSLDVKRNQSRINAAAFLLSSRQLGVADLGRSLGAGIDPLQRIPNNPNPTTSTKTPVTEKVRSTVKTKKYKRKKSKPNCSRRETKRAGINFITPPTTTIRPKQKTTSKPETFQQLLKTLPKPSKDNPNASDIPLSFHNELDYDDWGNDVHTIIDDSDASTHHAGATEQPVSVTPFKKKPIFPVLEANPYVCNISSIGVSKDKRLCGYPSFYNTEKCAAQFCSNDILSECENKGAMITFGATIVLLGIFIVIANSFLPYLVYRQPCMRNRHNYIKASLAFADILKGVLVCSVVPNIFWFHDLSEKDVVEVINEGRDSVIAIILGSLLMASSQSSTLHLMFLTLERFAAFKSPVRHSSIRTATIGYILAGVWFISIAFSFVPVIFPRHFEYVFFPVIFVYMLSSKRLPDASLGYHGILYCCLTILLPYVTMVVFSIWTGCVVSSKLQSSPSTPLPLECTSPSSPRTGFFRRKIPTLKPEFNVFKTLLIMIVAFSLTLVPVIVVVFLYNIGYYHCENYALPYTLAFYASISNSFVNVIIYTARDERFRKALMSEITGLFGGDKAKEFTGKQRQIRIFSTSSNLP